MTKPEAISLVALLRELWPSKFHYTPAMTELWVDRLSRPEFNRDQCEAVIRQCRAEDDGAKPKMSVILARCWAAHKTVRERVEANPGDIPAEKWAEIHRDRQAAAVWWHDVRESGEAPEVVRLATLAYPMWPKRWARFLDAAYKPKPIACMAMLAAWQEFHDSGARPKPAHEPGLMAGAMGM